MMTRDSAQPASSKWWWSGAIRKTRLPVVLKEATWMITDSASSTKSPPTIASSISCLVMTATAAIAAAERQRADVAHEDLGRVAVEPEEPERGAHERAAEDGELARLRDERDLQVARGDGVARDVREDRVGARPRCPTAPIARPSRPSVRFTAFEEPTTTSATNGM